MDTNYKSAKNSFLNPKILINLRNETTTNPNIENLLIMNTSKNFEQQIRLILSENLSKKLSENLDNKKTKTPIKIFSNNFCQICRKIFDHDDLAVLPSTQEILHSRCYFKRFK